VCVVGDNKVNDRGKIFVMEAMVDKTYYIDFGMILARDDVLKHFDIPLDQKHALTNELLVSHIQQMKQVRASTSTEKVRT
jgi:hypothetical protein